VIAVLVVDSVGLELRGSFGGSSEIKYGKICENGIIGTLYILSNKHDWENEVIRCGMR